MYDLEGLAREINLEKKMVYIEPEAHQMLVNAQSSQEVNQKGQSHKYVTLSKHRERIDEATAQEIKRKADIYQEQQRLVELKKKEEKDSAWSRSSNGFARKRFS